MTNGHVDGAAHLWMNAADDAVAWDSELAKFPPELRDVYHDRDYVALYVEDLRDACCFMYSEGDARYVFPFLLQRVPGAFAFADISTAYGYGGPIVWSSTPGFADRAHSAFRVAAEQRGAIAEVIKFHPLLANHWQLERAVDRLVPVCPVVYVDLASDPQVRWETVYTHANRKNINKAVRSGVAISFDSGQEEWAAFRHLYAETMRANGAAEFYRFSDAYFAGVQERLSTRHRVVVARLGGRIVAALLVLLGPMYVHCHLIGTERAAMGVGTNNLLHHELILWAAAEGFEKVLLGGGRSNSEDDTLLRFKRNFSDMLATLYVGESVLDQGLYSDACAAWRAANPDGDAGNRLLVYR